MRRGTSARRAGQAREIDWQAIHRRLDAVRRVVEQGWTPTAEERKAILKARARALAQRAAAQSADGQAIEIVEFALASETYAVESALVREVYPLADFTPLPCTPPFVLGIVNMRGEIVSIVDVKKFFELPEQGLTNLNQVIVLQSPDMTFGILEDAVAGARTITPDDVQPPPSTLSGVRADYIKGLTGERTVLLDAGKLLADSRIVVHETVAA